MTEFENLIQNFMVVESSSESHQLLFDEISNQIDDTKHSIQDLIALLEAYLTSSNDKERNRATTLLADLLHVKKSITLSSGVIHMFIIFFSRRLSDYPSVAPSLHALAGIIRFHGNKLDGKY